MNQHFAQAFLYVLTKPWPKHSLSICSKPVWRSLRTIKRTQNSCLEELWSVQTTLYIQSHSRTEASLQTKFVHLNNFTKFRAK